MDPVTILMGLAQFAPSLIKWATGSDTAGKVAEVAVNVAKTVTGKGSVEEAIESMNTDPALALQFKQTIMQQEMDFEKLYIDDKANARARDIALNSTPRGNVRANYLVGFALLTISACLCAVMFLEFKDEWAKSTVLLILGMYINELKNIYAFEFGTTRRSREKSDLMKDY